VQVGIQATGHSRWFERLLGELNYEQWVGDPARRFERSGCASRGTIALMPSTLLKLMLEDNFPRIWVPTPENRDVRQLVLDRHRLVGCGHA